jgi:hypothetical protein
METINGTRAELRGETLISTTEIRCRRNWPLDIIQREAIVAGQTVTTARSESAAQANVRY